MSEETSATCTRQKPYAVHEVRSMLGRPADGTNPTTFMTKG